MTCTCRTLLGGVVYRDDCDLHSPLPPEIPCARCPEPIGRREPRIPVVAAGGGKAMVHHSCADVRERLGLDDSTPLERQAKARAQRGSGDDKTPLFMQPGRMARLRRRR